MRTCPGEFLFFRRAGVADIRIQLQRAFVADDVVILISQQDGISDSPRLDFQPRTEVQGFKPVKRLRKIPGSDHNPMVLQHDRVDPALENSRNVLPELFASRQGVRCNPDLAANLSFVRKQPGIGNAPDNAERNQRWRMGMNDRFQIRTGLIDKPVEGKFAGWFVNSQNRTILLHAYHISPCKGAFVHPGGCYPNISVLVPDRQITPDVVVMPWL